MIIGTAGDNMNCWCSSIPVASPTSPTTMYSTSFWGYRVDQLYNRRDSNDNYDNHIRNLKVETDSTYEGISFVNDNSKIFLLNSDTSTSGGVYATLYGLTYGTNPLVDIYSEELIPTTKILNAFSDVGNTTKARTGMLGFVGNLTENLMIAIFGEGIKLIPITPPSNKIVKATAASDNILGISSDNYAAGDTASIYTV